MPPNTRPDAPTAEAAASGVLRLLPHLIVRDAARAIDFYARAFGAEETFRLAEPSGKVGHAEMRFGPATVMIADEHPDFGAVSPVTLGGSPVRILLEVEDVDAAVDKAVAAGATLLRPVKDEFYGHRTGQVADPYGHTWTLSAQVEDLAPDELQRRWAAMLETA